MEPFWLGFLAGIWTVGSLVGWAIIIRNEREEGRAVVFVAFGWIVSIPLWPLLFILLLLKVRETK